MELFEKETSVLFKPSDCKFHRINSDADFSRIFYI